MTHRLTTNYAKNYCNRTLIVKVIVENVVACFWGDTVYMRASPLAVLTVKGDFQHTISSKTLWAIVSTFQQSTHSCRCL